MSMYVAQKFYMTKYVIMTDCTRHIINMHIVIFLNNVH